MVRLSALGLEDDIKASLKPWECYYCGECSRIVQEANPGELMMSLRRYLTSKYDWTGLSGLMYKSLPAVWCFIPGFAGVMAFAFSVGFDLEKILHTGHLFEGIAIGTIGLLISLLNVARMWYFTILKPKVKVPFKKYVKSMGELFVHVYTKARTWLRR